MPEINENKKFPFAFDKNEIVQFTFDNNQILPFTFDYCASNDLIKTDALKSFLDAHDIIYERKNGEQITVLNQKIKNHPFIEKLFNLHLYA